MGLDPLQYTLDNRCISLTDCKSNTQTNAFTLTTTGVLRVSSLPNLHCTIEEITPGGNTYQQRENVKINRIKTQTVIGLKSKNVLL